MWTALQIADPGRRQDGFASEDMAWEWIDQNATCLVCRNCVEYRNHVSLTRCGEEWRVCLTEEVLLEQMYTGDFEEQEVADPV